MARSAIVGDGITCVNGHPVTAESVRIVAGKARCWPCHCERSRSYEQKAKAQREPRACEGCGILVDQTERKRRYCTRRCASNAAQRRRYQSLPKAERVAKAGYVPVPRQTIPCERCQAPVTRRGNEDRRFCEACGTGKGHVARARRYGVPIEYFDKWKVYERDGWICQVCHRPVDKGLSWPHTECASLDHIVPLSRGGAHCEANAQLAHLACNTGKGALLTS